VNCLKTDFFHGPAYPTYLYYNPYAEAREIHIDVGAQPVDLYDTVCHQFVSKRAGGKTSLRLTPDSAALSVLAPADGIIANEDNALRVNGVVVDCGAGEVNPVKVDKGKAGAIGARGRYPLNKVHSVPPRRIFGL